MARMNQVRIKNSSGGWDTKEVDPENFFIDDYPSDSEITYIDEAGDFVDVPIKDIDKVPKNIKPYYVEKAETNVTKPAVVAEPKPKTSFLQDVNSALSGAFSDVSGGLSTYPEAALDYLTSDAKSLQEAKQRGTAARDEFRARSPYYAAELTSGALQAAAMAASGGLSGAGKLGTLGSMATGLDTAALRGSLAAVDRVGAAVSPYVKPVGDVLGKIGVAPVQVREAAKAITNAGTKIGTATAIANEAAKIQRANETGDLGYLEQTNLLSPNLATVVHAAPALRTAGLAVAGARTGLNPLSSTRSSEMQQALTPESMDAIGDLPNYKKYPLQNIVSDNAKLGSAILKNASAAPSNIKEGKEVLRSDVANYTAGKKVNLDTQLESISDKESKRIADYNEAIKTNESSLQEVSADLLKRTEDANRAYTQIKNTYNAIKPLSEAKHAENLRALEEEYNTAKAESATARAEFFRNKNREANALFGDVRERVGRRLYEIEQTNPIGFRNELDSQQKATAYANSWGEDLIKDLKTLNYNTSTATPLKFVKESETVKNPIRAQVAVNEVIKEIRSELRNRSLSVVSIQDAAKEISDRLPEILREDASSAIVSKMRTALNRTASTVMKDISKFYPENVRGEINELADRRSATTELWREAYDESGTTVKGTESDAQELINKLAQIDPAIAGNVLQIPKKYNETMRAEIDLKNKKKFYNRKELASTPEIDELRAKNDEYRIYADKRKAGIPIAKKTKAELDNQIKDLRSAETTASKGSQGAIKDQKDAYNKVSSEAKSQQTSLESKLDGFIYAKDINAAEKDLVDSLMNLTDPSGNRYPGIDRILGSEAAIKSLTEKLRLANIVEKAKATRNGMLPKESVIAAPGVLPEATSSQVTRSNIFDDTGINLNDSNKMQVLQQASRGSGPIQDSMGRMDQIKNRSAAGTGIGIGALKYKTSPDLKYNAATEYLQNYSIKRKEAMSSIDQINKNAEILQPMTRVNRSEVERERRKTTAKATLQLITSSAKDGVIPRAIWNNFVSRYKDMPTDLYRKALEEANYIIEGF